MVDKAKDRADMVLSLIGAALVVAVIKFSLPVENKIISIYGLLVFILSYIQLRIKRVLDKIEGINNE